MPTGARSATATAGSRGAVLGSGQQPTSEQPLQQPSQPASKQQQQAAFVPKIEPEQTHNRDVESTASVDLGRQQQQQQGMGASTTGEAWSRAFAPSTASGAAGQSTPRSQCDTQDQQPNPYAAGGYPSPSLHHQQKQQAQALYRGAAAGSQGSGLGVEVDDATDRLPLDVIQSKDEYVLRVDVPGVEKARTRPSVENAVPCRLILQCTRSAGTASVLTTVIITALGQCPRAGASVGGARQIPGRAHHRAAAPQVGNHFRVYTATCSTQRCAVMRARCRLPPA